MDDFDGGYSILFKNNLIYKKDYTGKCIQEIMRQPEV
jgi:hypothetical protein